MRVFRWWRNTPGCSQRNPYVSRSFLQPLTFNVIAEAKVVRAPIAHFSDRSRIKLLPFGMEQTPGWGRGPDLTEPLCQHGEHAGRDVPV
jgi:hypothetical protein